MKHSILTLFLFIIGCTSEISLNQERYESKIVVDGWIEPNEPATVYLTLSSPFLTQYDSLSIVKTFLNHAKVTINSSDGEEEVLTLFRKKEKFPPYVYRSTELTGVANKSYRLKVEYKGIVITATTKIPEPPRIKQITFNQHSKCDGTLFVKYIPASDSAIYHYFQTGNKKYNFKLIPSFYPIQRNSENHNNIIEYELFAGRRSNINYTDPDTIVNDSVGARYFYIRDTVLVAVSSIDIQSFNVLNSITSTLSNYDNPFAVSSPAITNIDGGLGRWTGLGTTKVFFYVNSKDSTYSNNF